RLPDLDLADSIARMLDSFKTGRMGYAIEAIPLRYDGNWLRIGHEQVELGPLYFGVAWCITTEEEYKQQILPNPEAMAMLNAANAESILETLPQNSESPVWDKGFIVLLMGETGISEIAGFRAQFGLSLTSDGGFETGLRLEGSIAETLRLRIQGKVKADREIVAIEGICALMWKEKNLFSIKGDIEVNKVEKYFKARLEMRFSEKCAIEGIFFVGKEEMYLEGAFVWHYTPQKAIERRGRVGFTKDGAYLLLMATLEETEVEIKISLPGENRGDLLAGRVSLMIDDAFQKNFINGISHYASEAAAEGINTAYDELQTAIGNVGNLKVSIDSIRKGLPKICDNIIASVEKAISTHKDLKKWELVEYARGRAKPYLDRVRKLKRAAQKNKDDDHLRDLLKKAIKEVLAHKKLVIKKKIFIVGEVTFVNRELFTKSQENKLRKVISLIKDIPAKRQVIVEKQKVWDVIPERKRLLAGIQRDIDAGVTGAIPILESISFTTSLNLLDTKGTYMEVAVMQTGKKRIYSAKLDLTMPGKMATEIARQFS
ncbi:MAG: hypothetical protein AAGC85_10615, partial [Bacteroidota bacterium]